MEERLDLNREDITKIFRIWWDNYKEADNRDEWIEDDAQGNADYFMELARENAIGN